MSENTFYSQKFTIRANEVDTSGNLTLSAICNFFQEVAGNNAKELNFDITDMNDQNMTWVLQRMDINLNKSLNWREIVTVETWPAEGDSLRAYRNYRLLDDAGQEFGNCLSYWMVLNIETRRPMRIPKAVLDTRLANRPHVTEVKKHRIKPFTEKGFEKNIIVRRSDLDMNNHVNNVRYIEWMLETISLKSAQKIRNFDILFMRETFVDDNLVASSYKADDEHLIFKITNMKKQVIALAEALLKA